MPDTGITCPQIYYGTPTEINGIQVDGTGVLRGVEIFTGTPTVTVSGPTTSSPAVNTSILLINGQSVEPGRAITFTITGGSDGSDYAVKINCSTSASRVREIYVIYKVRVPTTTSP